MEYHYKCPMFVGWRPELGAAPSPAFVEVGRLDEHTRGQSWRDTRVNNLSLTVDVDLQTAQMTDQLKSRYILLPADSTMFDLVYKVYQFYEALNEGSNSAAA
ncbi:hypothetical protein LTR95_007523 [Oleoguttula sp. CCFEE 5521]